MNYKEERNVNKLRCEILRQACMDFVNCKQVLHMKKHGVFKGNDRYNRKSATSRVEGDLDEVTDFFYSEWFMLLYPKLAPQRLIDRLDKEYDKWEFEFDRSRGLHTPL